MKILHTADLHLRNGAENMFDILKWLITKGQELKIDLFIIAGDLFESDNDATTLRSTIRKIFESAPFRFLVIAGNHDPKSYNPNYDYGKNVIQLTQIPFEFIDTDDLRIVGVPYQPKKFSDCITNLPHDIDIIVVHGTLYDTSFMFSISSELEVPYMPIYPVNLENIARYVALGHIHSRTFVNNYKNTKTVYPGAPIALDTKCVGKRHVFYLEINRAHLSVKPVDVEIAPYWTEKEFFVFPGVEDKILDELDLFLAHADQQRAMYNIYIKGFIGESDKSFSTRLNNIRTKYAGKFLELRITPDHIQSWDRIMENGLARKFIEKTNGLEDKLRKKIFEIVLPIFSEITK